LVSGELANRNLCVRAAVREWVHCHEAAAWKERAIAGIPFLAAAAAVLFLVLAAIPAAVVLFLVTVAAVVQARGLVCRAECLG
jgi:hypothetical protein